MISVGKNVAHKIFFKDAELRFGQPVTFSAWDENGNVIFANQSPTFYIPDRGVCYYTTTTPNVDSYMLILATSNEENQGTVLRVGSPLKRVFYLRGDFNEGATTTYTIYDTSSNVLSSGIMDDVINGFYSTIVEGLSEPWFLEVNKLVG